MPKLTMQVALIRERLKGADVPRAQIAKEAQVGERTIDGFVVHGRVPKVPTLEKLESWVEQRDLSGRGDRVP